MIKSMTGYGTAEAVGCGKRFTVEIKSVNHRYSDISVKTPRNYGYLEEVAKKALSSCIVRGKVDVYISVESIEGASGDVTLNSEMAKGYYNALCEMVQELNLNEKVSIEHLVNFSDVFSIVRKTENSEEIINLVNEITYNACKSFAQMRAREGEKLYEDLAGGLDFIEQSVAFIEKRSPDIVLDYTKRIRERMEEILGNYPVDEGRLLGEVAIFSDKVNTSEETVRLKSHITQMRELLKSSEPTGRKLDFIIQEMNREANTIGSKCNDISITKTVIDIKAGIEKLREQIQNVE